MAKEPDFTENLEGKLGIGHKHLGAEYPIVCKGCGKYLTSFRMNEHCKIDFKITCRYCESECVGENIWAEKIG